MHFAMMLFALGLAILARQVDITATGTWQERWRRSLFLFLFPPLLLLATAVAILCMGPQGQMLGISAGWLSYLLAIAFTLYAIVLLPLLWRDGQKTWQQLRQHPQIDLKGIPARLVATPLLFSAQIGFWQPELVVSQGLLQTLAPEQLNAVLTHERAHVHYRDTFYFLGLGWLRRLTAWLPQTERLWQELLLLRELRADSWAAQQVDALVLAETLLLVVRHSVQTPEEFCAAFSCTTPKNRLAERIDALLAEPEALTQASHWSWSWLLLSLLPLVTVPFHHLAEF